MAQFCCVIRAGGRAPASDPVSGPTPELPCFCGDSVEGLGAEAAPDLRYRLRVHQPRVDQPCDELLSVADQLDGFSPWAEAGVEKVHRQVASEEHGFHGK